ncbi:hypothetical protein C0J52_00996 [Blattella germanica]|nr:hypothetical protein C0J52_00996 [Blattella germanica]
MGLPGVSVPCNSGPDVASVSLQFVHPSHPWYSWSPLPFSWVPDCLLFWSSGWCLALLHGLPISISLLEQRLLHLSLASFA